MGSNIWDILEPSIRKQWLNEPYSIVYSAESVDSRESGQ